MVGDVPHVADLVGELDEPGFAADRGGVLDLQALALRLGQALVVGHLFDDACDLVAEQLAQLGRGRLGILERVVQDGRRQHYLVRESALMAEQAGERDRMVDVGRSDLVLAALVAVLERREFERFQDQRQPMGGFGSHAPKV